VYASAAASRRAIFLGSYTGWFYALSLTSGRILWKYDAEASISGAASIINGVVYFSTLSPSRTLGLLASNGEVVFADGDGGFNPVVSDSQRLYLTTWGELTALSPLHP
jgi:outer membrane protein assembly factor BamB